MQNRHEKVTLGHPRASITASIKRQLSPTLLYGVNSDMKQLQPQDTSFAATTPQADDTEAVSFAPDETQAATEGLESWVDDTAFDELNGLLEEVSESDVSADESLQEAEFVDTEEASDTEFGGSSNDDDPMIIYDVPRPALTLDEASCILGKSIRSIERGIQGRWGNRLPEGWKARKMKIDGQDEWRIIPPPNFRIRHSKVRTTGTQRQEEMTNKVSEKVRPRDVEAASSSGGDSLFGFTLNSLIQTTAKKAKTELARAAEYALDSTMEHPTIVIDRSDEVERLLRELADVHKELASERRARMEDLRLISDMQSSMRLLEMKSSQTATLKDELAHATTALKEHRLQYQEFLSLPWWKRLFRRLP